MQAKKPLGLNKISNDAEKFSILNEAGLMEIERALLKSQTSLNGSLARIRINGQALNYGNNIKIIFIV